jgi:hypothetical protein
VTIGADDAVSSSARSAAAPGWALYLAAACLVAAAALHNAVFVLCSHTSFIVQ